MIGVPKTIDNDLEATAMTLGFDSAASCVTDALDRPPYDRNQPQARDGAGSHAAATPAGPPFTAGWRGGADIILIPEIPFDYEKVAAEVAVRREKEGAKSTMIAVAEGAFPQGRQEETSAGDRQRRTPPRRHRRAGRLRPSPKRTGKEVLRCGTGILGHLQRRGAPTPRSTASSAPASA